LTAVELYERGGRQNTEAAVDFFSDLTQSHPLFAQGHIGLARALVFLGTYYTSKENVISEALDHCAAARRLTSGSAEAFAAEGFIHAVAGDSRRSAACFQMALALRPDDAETHYLLGRASMVEYDWSTAVLIFERAISLRPTDCRSLLIAGKMRLGLGHHQSAAVKYRSAVGPIEEQLALDPNDVRALRGKARCLWQVGRREEAFDLMDALTRQPDPLNYQLACALACAGENERALNVLEEAVELGWRHKAWMDRDPDLDRLRGHPRFERIRQSIS
jgi:adenylate cyclase